MSMEIKTTDSIIGHTTVCNNCNTHQRIDNSGQIPRDKKWVAIEDIVKELDTILETQDEDFNVVIKICALSQKLEATLNEDN